MTNRDRDHWHELMRRARLETLREIRRGRFNAAALAARDLAALAFDMRPDLAAHRTHEGD